MMANVFRNTPAKAGSPERLTGASAGRVPLVKRRQAMSAESWTSAVG